MSLTTQQLTALRAACFNDASAAAFFVAPGNAAGLKDYLNTQTAAFYVWRTNVTRAQIYYQTSGEGTTWDWTTYKNQTQGEQGAWVQMFMGDQADFSLPNLRAGVAAIFSGTGAQAAQRAHVFTAAKRKATNAEKMLANTSGGNTGALATPAVLTFEGEVDDVEAARLIYKDNGDIWTAQG